MKHLHRTALACRATCSPKLSSLVCQQMPFRFSLLFISQHENQQNIDKSIHSKFYGLCSMKNRWRSMKSNRKHYLSALSITHCIEKSAKENIWLLNRFAWTSDTQQISWIFWNNFTLSTSKEREKTLSYVLMYTHHTMYTYIHSASNAHKFVMNARV